MLIINNIIKGKIKLFWSQTNRKQNQINFGDALNPLLIERVFKRGVIYASLKDCDLIGVGSILERAEAISKELDRSFNVWGSGFIQDGETLKSTRLRYHAVRGKLTEKRIPGTVKALGDPGLLSSLLISKRSKKKYKYAIVPHYVDKNSKQVSKLVDTLDSVKVVDVFDNPLEIIREIDKAEIVLSSSLHGLIVADSLGIPNIRLVITDKIIGGNYKYDDYYSIFDMMSHPLIDLRNNTLLNEREIVDGINKFSRPNLDDIREQIINSFPY